MQYTSAEAAKLLHKTKEELAAVLEKENKAGIFTAAVGENIEDVRPAYDFAGTRKKVKDYHDRIRKIKHAMNEFNLRTLIPEFSMRCLCIFRSFLPRRAGWKQWLPRFRRNA